MQPDFRSRRPSHPRPRTSSRSALELVVGSVAALAMFVACGSETGSSRCTEGDEVACTCAIGDAGERRCDDKGELGECTCTAEPDGTDVTSDDTTDALIGDTSELDTRMEPDTETELDAEVEPDTQTGHDAMATGCSPACRALEQCNQVAGRATPLCVAKSVPITGGYTIDATEVTRAQYEAWLAGSPSTDDQDAWCTWNTTFTQGCEPPPQHADTQLPVVCVDWCDAYAYCEAVGKRLCGKIGGGSNAYEDHADATKSQWFNACSSGGEHTFSYGDTFDIDACADSASYEVVGNRSTCQSSVPGYEGVFDLSGSVFEWQDSCKTNFGRSDTCRMGAGGAPDSSFAKCAFGLVGTNRDYAQLGVLVIGFRCCAP